MKKILLVLALIIAGLAIFVARQPEDYRVERKITISAPAEAVFAQVNDFHRWTAWSPWIKLDPKATYTFEGPQAGPGAVFKWAGDDKVGEGAMTVLESRPNDAVKIRLDFIKPMTGAAAVDFTFKSVGEQTEVAWIMTGKNNFISKAMCMFISMDKMIGGDFERGLSALKASVEAAAGAGAPQ